MPSVIRLGDPLVPHIPWSDHILNSGSADVITNGRGTVRVGDSTTIHYSGKSKHSSTQATGSGTVFVNGKPVARTGDQIACGSIDGQGSPNVNAG